MGDPTYPLFSIFAFLGFVLALVPMPWHFQSWNAGTCVYMIWTSISSLIQFVDSIVWNGNIDNPAPVWCDISTKFLIGAGVGIPASSLCINRRLYKISSMRAASITQDEKRRAVYEDLAIGVGIPCLVMVLHYVVQGHRFNILEDVGCTPDIWNTPPAYPLVFMWPVLLGCVSFVYASLTLRLFWRRRAQFNELLASNSALSTSRYLRLMLLCCIEMACTVPLGVFSIYINNDGLQIAPYISWSNAHYNFSFVEKFPAVVWMSRRPFYISVQMGRWIYPGSALLFFALFGFAEEARRNYRIVFWAVAKHLGIHPPSQNISALGLLRFGKDLKGNGLVSNETLPAYAATPVRGKRPLSLLTLAGSVIDIDLEKATTSPALISATLARVGTPTSSESSPRKSQYDELASNYQPHSPTEIARPSPVAHSFSEREHISIPPYNRPFTPPYHRPFTPPTIYALSAADALAQSSSIQVTIHTEATEAT